MVQIRIVENVREDMKKTDKYAEEVIAGKVPIDKKRAKYTIVLTPEGFSHLFSPERVRLMLRIKKNKVMNIYQLAKELGRQYEAVHRDIKELESYKLIKVKTKDNKKIPYIYENITLAALA
jgi:predicted transcriptional regulator